MRAIIGSCFFSLLCVSLLYAEPLTIGKRRYDNAKPRSSVEIFSKKNDFFIDEPIICYIRFTYDKKAYIVQSLIPPTVHGADLVKITLVDQRDETITNSDGSKSLYGVCEWHGLLYPKKQGTIHVEPFQIVTQQTAQQGKSFFGFALQSSVTFVSHDIFYTIHELPPMPSGRAFVPALVGQVKTVQLEFDAITLAKGQACTARLIINGLCNASRLPHPSLYLPEGLKAYPSTFKDQGEVVIFEYAIQALQEGNYAVESQRFIYFDTEKQKYSEIESPPFSLYVMEGSLETPVQKKTNIIDIPLGMEDGEDEILENNEAIIPLIRTLEIPWYFFMGIMFFLICCGIMQKNRSKLCHRYVYSLGYVKYRWSLFRLSRLCTISQNKDSLCKVYRGFKVLGPMIDWKNVHEVAREDWRSFYRNLEIQVFNSEDDNEMIGEVLKQAQKWIAYLKTIDICIT